MRTGRRRGSGPESAEIRGFAHLARLLLIDWHRGFPGGNDMRNWQTWSGSAVWMLVATLMMFAALQPVEVSAATAQCSGLAIGCESGRL
jgi:hypothetical protein